MNDRCKTCKWWTLHDESWRNSGLVVFKAACEVRECTSPKLHFYEPPAADEASVTDGSEYTGNLWTGPDFGCVNHEAA